VIRSNLSTRPFYNERAVQLWILVLGLIVVAATLFNVASIIGYSQTDTELATEASSNEARAAELRSEAARLRATVNTQQIELASIEARQANELIDRRTFSWTDLFNQFETTFPDDVRIVAVRPKIDDKGGMRVSLSVIARGVDDVDELMIKLENTGSFKDLLSVEERFNTDGLLEATVEGSYSPKPVKRDAPEAKKP
jgi:Tfp pilus assembly protein PilN